MPQRAPVEPIWSPELIRDDFPLIAELSGTGARIYLDNAASAQKPRCVMDSMTEAAFTRYANVHRGAHWLSDQATAGYEGARARLRTFLNAPSAEQIIFTKSATEAINLVASGFAATIEPGDEIVVSALDHHANLVPWHMLRERKGAVLRWVDPDPLGHLDPQSFARAITSRTRLVAVTHMSNVVGMLTPLEEIVRVAHDRGVPILADGTQAVVHHPVDVATLDVDFYALTGHKLYGPTGIGALYAKREWLERMPPMLGGGEMVAAVGRDHVDYAPPPHRFEAGTPRSWKRSALRPRSIISTPSGARASLRTRPRSAAMPANGSRRSKDSCFTATRRNPARSSPSRSPVPTPTTLPPSSMPRGYASVPGHIARSRCMRCWASLRRAAHPLPCTVRCKRSTRSPMRCTTPGTCSAEAPSGA